MINLLLSIRNSPAARYLSEKGIIPRDFNSYGSRRGNDLIMTRGTFANTRLTNFLVGGSQTGPKTLHIPTRQQLDIYDASVLYKSENIPMLIIAGKDYGSGSSRDWAVKGPWLLVRIKCSYRNDLKFFQNLLIE